MTFTTKTEDDAYDKLLDTAEALYEILDQSNLAGDHSQREALSMYLAENKDSLLDVLGSKKKSPQKMKKNTIKEENPQLDLADAAPKKPLEDLIIEPDEEALYDDDENTVVFDDEEENTFIESDAA